MLGQRHAPCGACPHSTAREKRQSQGKNPPRQGKNPTTGKEPPTTGKKTHNRERTPHGRERTPQQGKSPPREGKNPQQGKSPHAPLEQTPGVRAARLLSLFKDSVQALSKEINKAASFESFRNNGLFHFPSSLWSPGPGFCLFCAASLMVPDWSVSDFIPMGDVKS